MDSYESIKEELYDSIYKSIALDDFIIGQKLKGEERNLAIEQLSVMSDYQRVLIERMKLYKEV